MLSSTVQLQWRPWTTPVVSRAGALVAGGVHAAGVAPLRAVVLTSEEYATVPLHECAGELDEVPCGHGPGITAVVPFRAGAAMDVAMYELLVLLPTVARDPVTETAASGQGDHWGFGVFQQRNPRGPGDRHLPDGADRPGRAPGDDRRVQVVQQLIRRPGAISGLARLRALHPRVSTAMGIDLPLRLSICMALPQSRHRPLAE